MSSSGMSSTVTRQLQQQTVGMIVNSFAGRPGTLGYDESKIYQIHRKNRPFVWSRKTQEWFLDSILRSYDVSSILCSAKRERDGQLKYYLLDGGNRITTLRKILNNEIRALTPEERMKVEMYTLNVVILSNMSEKDEREMFRRAANGVKPTDGHLYKMSEIDSHLVQLAVMILEDRTFPHRALMTQVMFDTTPTEHGASSDTKSQANLANMVALISGLMNGPDFITKSFDRQYRWVDAVNPINRDILFRKIHDILSIFKEADSHVTTAQTLNLNGLKRHEIMTCLDKSGVHVRNKTKGEMIEIAKSYPAAMTQLVTFANTAGIVLKDPNAHIKKRRLNSGDLIGLMVYDYHMMSYPEMKAKWVQFIREHDQNPKIIKETILTLSGAQNTTANSLAKKSKRIAIYLAENHRIATEDELANVTHPRNDESVDDLNSIEDERDEDEDHDEEAEDNE
jgi:hypothetical protein